MKVRDCIRLLETHGWRCVRQKGSHMRFKNPAFPNVALTVPKHNGDLKPGTLRAILKAAGLLDKLQ